MTAAAGGRPVEGSPLVWRRDASEAGALLLTALSRPAGPARRETLLALSQWAREAGNAVCVLPGAETDLFSDFRALGFDDAGPLSRYAAPTRPGGLRRFLTGALLPGRRPRPGLTSAPFPLPDPDAGVLRRRLAPRFEVISAERPAASSDCATGAHVRLDGQPAAEALGRARGDGFHVSAWIAPPGRDGQDVTAALADATLEAASRAGAARVVFETTHAELGRGLLLARFLPARARCRVLVRLAPKVGARRRSPGLRAPLVHAWHLESATRIRRGHA